MALELYSSSFGNEWNIFGNEWNLGIPCFAKLESLKPENWHETGMNW